MKRFGIVALLLIVGATLAALSLQPARAASNGGCTSQSQSCVISAADAYIKALVSHDGNSVPLAPSARRTENGMVTGTSGPGIANDLSTNRGDQAIYDARDVRWFVSGDEAIAYYLLDTAAPGQSIPHTTTVHLAERFKVDNGLIYQIEAIFWTNPGSSPDSDCWTSPCTSSTP